MSKEKKKGMMVNNLEVVSVAKEHFLSLCLMYEQMGNMHKLMSKAITHPMFSKTTIPVIEQDILFQYSEMGEELKNIGAALDLMPGKKVMKPEPEPEPDENEFVNNIEPEKKHEE